MADGDGFGFYATAIQNQLNAINETLKSIREENFTKADMATFKEDVCSPRGIQQKEISAKVESHEKFKIQMMLFPVIIGVLFSAATLIFAFLQMQNFKVELKNTAAVESSKTVQTVTAIEKSNK